MVLFYYYKTKREVITLATKLEEFLNEISEGSEIPVESEEAVKDNRINSGLSLQELSKIIGISECDLQDF